MVWKQPLKDNKRLAIQPEFDAACTVSQNIQYQVYAEAISEIKTLKCPLISGKIYLKGLENTLTDSYVSISYLNGEKRTGIVGAARPVFNINQAKESFLLPTYLSLGVNHIFAGWDHLALVVGLLLLVSSRHIWLVITSFTLAHSLTLGVATFGLISLPSRPIEILIALSIAWLAYEAIVQKHQQKSNIYGLSFAFGLLHGFGFASVLANLGLPETAALQALLFFNVGIEIGQIIFISICLIAVWGGRKSISAVAWGKIAAVFPYALGGVGMFWVISRLSNYII